MNDHISVDIDDPNDHHLVYSLERRLEGIQSASFERGFSTIYQVSSLIQNLYLYEPRIVAIGPYHRGKGKYRAMEEHKLRFLRDLLDANHEVSLGDYISKLTQVERRAREYYDKSVMLNSGDFIQMLLLDSCFILGISLNWYFGDNRSLRTISSHISYIRSDMLLLENQLPFFVIEEVFSLCMRNGTYAKKDVPLFRIVYKFLMGDYRKIFPISDPVYVIDALHLLDFFHTNMSKLDKKNSDPNEKILSSCLSWFKKCCSARFIRADQGDERLERCPAILSATWLVQAGVKFKNAGPSSSLFDVVFEKDTLYVPTFRVDSEHMALLANLVVFEQNKEMKDRTVSSYVLLMDSLIDTSDDVKLLVGCGLISNALESNQDAAAFFNSLGAHCKVDPKEHYYAPLFKKVSHFYKSKWNRSKASFLSKYFDSPWTGFSLVAASVLLIFTGLQTYYTVAGYYHQ